MIKFLLLLFSCLLFEYILKICVLDEEIVSHTKRNDMDLQKDLIDRIKYVDNVFVKKNKNPCHIYRYYINVKCQTINQYNIK
jgi:hypothetical protein